jgi:hypothetical protein
LRRLTDPNVRAPAELAARARRLLALHLAKGPGPLEAALALLDENVRALGPNVDDDRARAVVLASRPDRRREALGLLRSTATRQPLAPAEQFLLAQLYDEAGEPSRAIDVLLGLLADERPDPEHLAYYVRGLIGRGDLDGAGASLDRLERLEPNSARTPELREALAKARRRS